VIFSLFTKSALKIEINKSVVIIMQEKISLEFKCHRKFRNFTGVVEDKAIKF
jgi:hypothetical protein